MAIVVKSFSVGNGDMFYINHSSDNFTSIDCCYVTEEDRDSNFEEIRKLSFKKGVRRFISTHPDEDHIRGINKFDEIVGVSNFYCVENEATKEDETDNFRYYCRLRDDGKLHFFVKKGCTRLWMNESDETRKSSGINFLWPDISDEDFKEALKQAKNGVAFNNISPIFTYTLASGPCFMWMGDLEHDFVDKIKDKVSWAQIDILFAPHHGRKSGRVPSDVLEKLNPGIIVVGEAPSKDLEYYSGFNTLTQNSAGDITFDCENDTVRIYVGNENYEADFLEDEGLNDSATMGHYIGSYISNGK